jgi:cation diffusion facilitator family transporter
MVLMQTSKGPSESRVVLTSFLVDLLDIIVNLIVSLLTGSAVMLTEFFQGVADLTSAGFLLIGNRSSTKKANDMHPFGYGKETYFWTLISAVIMMTLAAATSIYIGVTRLLHPHEIGSIPIAFAVLLFTMCTNGYSLSLSSRRLLQGVTVRKLPHHFFHSNSVATKNAFVLDLMGTSAAIFGLISLGLYQLTGEVRFDSIGAIVIGISTAVLALILIVGVKDFLVGKRGTPEIEKQVKDIALSVPDVRKVLDLRTMQVGTDKLLVNMEVHMANELTTDQLELLIDKIKKNIKDQIPSIEHIQVELERP